LPHIGRQFVIRRSKLDSLSTIPVPLVNNEYLCYNTVTSKSVVPFLDDFKGHLRVGRMSMASIKKEFVPLSNVERATEIFSEYGDFILGVIRYQASNHALADDLFQDFFLSLVSKPIPQNIQNVKSYLYRAITNDIADAARRVEKYRARMHKYAECLNYSINKSNPEDALIEIEQINKMFKLIEGCLPHSEAQAIALRYRHNYSIKEVAEKIHVNRRSVSRYISAGLSKLRQFLTVKQGD
jgi:RNA polymerase sigma factor (sigma-70 family)